MINSSKNSLLPIGFTDTLYPEASNEAHALKRIITFFSSNGYQQVNLPLLEFEESLFDGTGVSMTEQTFRLMDPISQKMMGIRADMTPQIARVATTRLKGEPRPLRLCYGGQVLRIKGSQLRPKRQFTQVGAELIGTKSPIADAEVVLIAVSALRDLGVKNISVDLGLPRLVPNLMNECGIKGETATAMRSALNRKDFSEVCALADSAGQKAATIFPALMSTAGPVETAIKKLNSLKLGDSASLERSHLEEVAESICAGTPGIGLTIDPIEDRSFKYHAGVTFSLYCKGIQGELGSGGRYMAGNGKDVENATGLTLFLDTLIKVIPNRTSKMSIFLPYGTPLDKGAKLRAEGWITINSVEKEQDPIAEAIRLKCDTYLSSKGIEKI